MKQNRCQSSFCDISFTSPCDMSYIGASKIVRRKTSEVSNNDRLLRKVIGQSDISRSFYVPTKTLSISPPLLIANVDSCPITRQNSKEDLNSMQKDTSFRRFQRKSEKSFENLRPLEKKNAYMAKECEFEDCLEEKKIFKKSIDNLRAKNEKLEKERDKMAGEMKKVEERLKAAEMQLKEKLVQIAQLNSIATKKDQECNKLTLTMIEKNKLIVRLEALISQVRSTSKSQMATVKKLVQPEEGKTEKIIQLAHQLKYKQLETHMLKKQRYDIQSLQTQVKNFTKENKVLKERLQYLLRLKNKFYVEDSSSTSSFSLSISQNSPQKRKSESR